MDPFKRAQGLRRPKRELDEDEDTLFMSREKIRKQPVPIDTHREDTDDSDEEGQSEDEEDDLNALDEQIQERIDGFDCPYDSTTENLPSHPTFHTGFTQVERDYVDIVHKAVSHLQSAKYQDAETARLVKLGLSIEEIKYASGTKVAFIGNSGVGKSSVINSLFDTPELAPEGSTGRSCTNVVTEIRKGLPGQRKPFAAEIILFDEAVRRSIIQRHVDNYYRYFVESQEDLDKSTVDDNKIEAMTALETFRALFCDRDEFHDDRCAMAFLKVLKSGKDERILLKLQEWTDTLLATLHAENGVVCREAYTIEKLAEQIEPFTRTPCVLNEDSSEPAPWPLVQIVRLGVHSSFVKTGLVVADLPGLSDTNANRVRATQRYKRECNFACIVAPISRVLTDNLVEKWLEEAFETWKSNKALICTYTDAMDVNTKVRDLASTRDDIDEHNTIVKAFEAISNEIMNLTTEMRSAKGKAARKPLLEKKQELVLKKAVVLSMRRESLIKLRNKKVINAIRKRYKDITNDQQPLQVFCISNSDYIQHRNGYDGNNVPMTLETTGIPALRTFLLGLPADSKLHTLEHYCEGPLPEFISSLEMWSTQSALERKAELQKIVSRPREVAHVEIGKVIEQLKSTLTNCILTKIRDSVDCWVGRGRGTCQRWATWNASTYVAFIKHDGNHATKSKMQQSWNTQLLEPVVEDLRTPWKFLEETWKETIEKCVGSLSAMLDAVRVDLKASPSLSLTSGGPFLSSLIPKKAMLRAALQNFGTQLEIASRNVKIDATTDELDGFLVLSMAKVYAECAELSGTGSHGRRCAMIEKQIMSGDSFHAIYNGVKEAFEDHLTTQHPSLLRAVEDVFDRVLEDFGRQFVLNEVCGRNAEKLRASLRKFCRDASFKINGPMRLNLASAKALAE